MLARSYAFLSNFHRSFQSIIMRTFSDYENAIVALNGLQSNASILDAIRKQRVVNPEKNIDDMTSYLEKIGLKVADLDRLNVIHVAGTKGKGSVCAMAESIFRGRGLKTGFYSSPHLVHVRERIRIGGTPLTEEQFAKYFWPVYNRLIENTNSSGESLSAMPAYFKFLTLMAFHVFLAEKVDVAIVEVGIGGSYDCTNVVSHPVVCCITSLDYDHMSVLGNTLEQIAWHKAGIMKSNSVAITMDQPPSCISVLIQRSTELNCPLFFCPPLSDYSCGNTYTGTLELGIPGRQQLENASMALQLVHMWMRRRENPKFIPDESCFLPGASTSGVPILKPFALDQVEVEGLKKCRWPGRSQILHRGPTTFYLDGAHTPKSMELCSEWFRSVTNSTSNTDDDVVRILVFNCTADRTPEVLLSFLLDCDFHCAIFCPNLIDIDIDAKSELTNLNVCRESQLEKCELNRQAWLKLRAKRASVEQDEIPVETCTSVKSKNARHGYTLMEDYVNTIDWCLHYPKSSRDLTNFSEWSRKNGVCNSSQCVTAVFPCIASTLRWIQAFSEQKNVTAASSCRRRDVRVLVTGSLHLVGGVLSILDPELDM